MKKLFRPLIAIKQTPLLYNTATICVNNQNRSFSASGVQLTKDRDESARLEQINNMAKSFIQSRMTVGLNAHLGVKLEELHLSNIEKDSHSGFIEMSLVVSDHHMNPIGLVHGGTFSTLSDTCIGTGAMYYASQHLEDAGMVVIDSYTQYTRAASLHDVLHCIAKPKHLGKRTQTWEATIYVGNPSHNFVASRTQSTILNVTKEDKENAHGNLKKLGTNFNINAMSKEEIATRFDKYSEQWEYLTHVSEYQKLVMNWIANRTKQLTADNTKSNLQILDLATGIGLVGKTIKRALGNTITTNMVGLDLSEGMIKKAKELEIYNKLFTHDLDKPITSLESGNQFDLITCFGVTEMLKDVDGVLLNEIQRLLKKDGQCWLSFQYNNGTNTAAHQGMKNFTKEEIESILQKHNLKIEKLEILDKAYLLPDPSTGQFMPVPFCIVVCKPIQ